MQMEHRERVKLLFGPYRPPALRRGQRTFCLARGCDVVVTSWTAARIPWPRCHALGTYGGGTGILVTAELARAVRHESATAVRYWWGVGTKTIAWWRRALGVARADPEGSRRLILPVRSPYAGSSTILFVAFVMHSPSSIRERPSHLSHT